MDNIAFKRARNSKVKEGFHPDFIVVYHREPEFPEGTFKPEEGWEILPEDQFNTEFAKNPMLHKQFVLEQDQIRRSLEESAKAEELFRRQQAKELDLEVKKEFEAFRKWKLTQPKFKKDK